MSKIQTYLEDIDGFVDRMTNQVNQLDEEQIRWKPADTEWSIMEVICHVEEALLYWTDELRRVIAAGGIEWGRGMQDEARLEAIRQAATRNLPTVLLGIQKACEYCKEQLSQLNDQQLQLEAPHRNPKFGVQSMNFLIEHFITEHLHIHAKQVERNINHYHNYKLAANKYE